MSGRRGSHELGRGFTRREALGLLAPVGLLALFSGCGRRLALPAAQADTPSAEPPLWFVDAQERAGLSFTHSDGGCGRHFFVEQIGAGCGFVDVHNDGWPAIYAVNGAPLPGYKGAARPRHELYRNRRDGTFENITERAGLGSTRYGTGVCAGDFDNDGHIDLFVTCYGKNHLYRNMGDGTFRDVADQAGVAGDGGLSTSACFFDYDNDGWLDLYVCHYVQWTLKDDRWCGRNKLTKSYCGPEVYPARLDALYRNNRDGTFTDVTHEARIAQPHSKSLGVVATDVDNDGWVDLYVTCDLMPNLLFINNRDGTFTERGVEYGVAFGQDGGALAGMGVSSGDYDNDGRMDLFVTDYSYEMYSLYRNAQPGLFTYESLRTGIGPPTLIPLGFGTRFADLDNDGWQDVVIANGHVLDDAHETNEALEYAQTMQIFQNHGGRTFEDISAGAGPAFKRKFVGRGLAIGDYDNDGRLDVLVNNVNGPLRLIHNESHAANRWLKLNLTGTRCNRSAIGARVSVRTRYGWQTQEVVSGSSFLSQSDLRLHFGLKDNDAAEEVRVRWPGAGGKPGSTEVWHHLAGNSTHTLVEGASPPKGEA